MWRRRCDHRCRRWHSRCGGMRDGSDDGFSHSRLLLPPSRPLSPGSSIQLQSFQTFVNGERPQSLARRIPCVGERVCVHCRLVLPDRQYIVVKLRSFGSEICCSCNGTLCRWLHGRGSRPRPPPLPCGSGSGSGGSSGMPLPTTLSPCQAVFLVGFGVTDHAHRPPLALTHVTYTSAPAYVIAVQQLAFVTPALDPCDPHLP